MQRNLSRKGTQRWGDRNMNGGNVTVEDKDIVPTTCSPRGTIAIPKCYRLVYCILLNLVFVFFHLLVFGSSWFDFFMSHDRLEKKNCTTKIQKNT